MTEFEMKYIGWNIGATRIERRAAMSDIEILELKINGVDVLELLRESIDSDTERLCPKGYAWIVADCDFDGDCGSCQVPDAPIKSKGERMK